MTRDEITALANPATFEPFTIITGAGARFRVPHADFIDIPPMPEDEGDAVPSYVIVYGATPIPRFVVLAQISAIEFHEEPA